MKSELIKMGTVQDMKLHIKQYQVDNPKRQVTIKAVCHLIFEMDATVHGECIWDLLDDGSYVPINICKSILVINRLLIRLVHWQECILRSFA